MDVRQLAFLARQPSAAIQPRERFWGISKRGLAFVLANALFWQPLWAQAGGLAVSGQGTTTTAAANGVPIVNIAAPNASGLSHNQFSDYNVGSQGLILNNATSSTQSTQLGGIILGNSNLKGQAASTILNEVTGNNRSQLNGYTEVAGQAAHVIVANPYGITCDGCGFINTPKATLTTGKPVLDASGKLDHYQVDGGDVAIDGAGINAGNVDSFEVITRSARINAQINANQLTVIAGRNDVDAGTLKATARADDGSAKPNLAIDSTALGGMYAGAIKLVGTEQGVGVNLAGNLAASAGDIELDANGQLNVAQVAASGAVKATAQSITTHGPVYAGSHLDATTTGDLNNSQNLAARDAITLSSGGQLSNSGIIEAGVNSDNSRNSSGDVSLSAQTVSNTGNVIASRQLTTQANLLDNQGGAISAAQAQLKGGSLNNSHGQLKTQGDLTVALTGDLTNTSGLFSSECLLTASAASLSNRLGSLSSAGQLSLTTTGTVDNQGGKLFSNSALTLDLNHGTLGNQSGLITAPVLVLKNVGAVDNSSGEISSAQTFDFSADSLTNDNGKLLSNQALSVTVNQALSNLNGTIAAASLHVQAASLNNAGGTLNSQGDLTLNVSGQLTNNNLGLINADGTLAINAAGIDNSAGGNLLGSAIALDFGAATGELNNASGLITTTGQLTVSHLRDLNNQNGELSSSQSLTLAGRTLDNTGGKLISDNLLVLNANSLLNPGGLVSGWQGVTVTAGSLDNRNSGTVSSRYGDVTVTVQGDLLNGNNGALVSQGALNVSADNLDNSAGILSSAAGLTLQAISLTNNAGSIAAQNAFTFTGTTFDNSNGSVTSNGAGTLNLLGVLTNTNGKLATGADLLIQGATQVNNQHGQLASQTLLTLLTAGLDNSNSGTIAANDALTLTATGAVQNNADGLIYSQNADLNLSAASLANSRGTLQSQTALTVTTSGDIDNQSGTLLAQTGDLTINAVNLDSRGGTLGSQQGAFTAQLTGALKNGYDLTNASQKGSVQAQSLTITSASLDNDGGRIAAQTGDAVISTGDFNNQNGGLYATGKVKVTAHDFDNSGAADGQIGGQQIDLSLSGALNNENGLVESDSTLSITAASIDNQAGQLRALGTSGSTLFNVSGLLNNSNGTLETANQNLTLNLGSFSNVGGSLLHVGTGTFGIATANLSDVGGSVVTNGSLTIDADNWTNSSVIQAGDLTVNVAGLTQTGSGQLLGSSHFTGTGSNWNNDGLIASNGALGLTLGGTYGGNGRLTSVGDLNLSAAQVSLGSAASIEGGADATLNVSGQLSNAGRLNSAAALTVTAGGVDNEGTFGSGTGLILTTGALSNNQGLIFSGGDMSLRVASLNNSYANIYSLGNLSIDRDGQGGLTDSIVNSSSTIQSDGNMTLNVSTLDNQRAVLVVDDAGKYTAEIVEVSCYKYLNNSIADCDGKQNYVYEITERDKLAVTASSAASSISAGGNLNIVAGQVNNASSTISAGQNLSVSADSLTNQGVIPTDTQTFRVFETEREDGNGRWSGPAAQFTQKYWIDSSGYNPADLSGLDAALSRFIASTQNELTQYAQTTQLSTGDQSYAAVIQAGGAVNITTQNNFDSSVVRAGYDYVGAGTRTDTTAAGTAYSTRVSLNAQLPPDLAQKEVDPLSLPGFSLPTGQNGLFRLSGTSTGTATGSSTNWTISGTTQANSGSGDTTIARVQGVPDTSAQSQPQKYLIETNPALTNLKQFMSSDYMLSALGYNPDDSEKRLGDGLYEQTLVDQAIVAKTGARYIDGQTSDAGQFQYLMDNGIAAQQSLNLTVGTALTSEQVAALTHDIVWMQSEVVDGQTVLVPVLYLANANNRLAPDGALVQGTDVSVIAGSDLSNAGTLKATGSLSAIAGNNLTNTGVVQADSRLDLLAGNNLTNSAGGIIAGRDVSLTAVSGDVTNERTVTSHQSALGSATERTDFVDSAARVEAAGSLTINAGQDVNNTGGVLSSGTTTSITATRDVNITAAQAVDSSTRTSKHTRSTTTQNSATVTAGTDLSISAGQDLTATASQLTAGGNVALTATDNLSLSSAADETHSYSKTHKVTSQQDHVAQVGTTVAAGGSATLQAGQDVTLTSSNVTAGTDAYVYAGDKLQLLAAQNSDYSLYDMKKSGSWGSKKTQHDETTQVTNVGSAVTSGGDLTLASNSDQLYQAAKLNSGNDLTISSGGAVTFEGVKDLHQETHTKSSTSLSWNTMKGKGSTDETLQQTEMTAKGKTVINAVNGLNIDVKQINKETVSQVIDTMVKADPSLSWLKDAEARGDVNWQQVKELHDSFKYSSSSLGEGAMLAIVILVTVLTAGAASGEVGMLAGAEAGSGSAMAAATTSAELAQGIAYTAAGWGNVAATAAITSLASSATVNLINDKGNLGSTLGDTFSSSNLKSVAISSLAAGATSYVDAKYFTAADGASSGGSKVITTGVQNPGYSTAMLNGSDLEQTLLRSGSNALISAGITTAIGGGSFTSNLASAATSEAIDLGAAEANKAIGDLKPAFSEKVVLHALLGGLISEAKGGDFESGVIAGGAAEGLTPIVNALLATYVSDEFAPGELSTQGSQDKVATAQIIGLVAAAASGGKASTGSLIGGASEKYNNQAHEAEREDVERRKEMGLPPTLQEEEDLGIVDVPKILQGPSLGGISLAGALSRVLGFGTKSGVPDASFTPNPDITSPYVRPQGAGPNSAQRASVQGLPCVDCGAVSSNQVADHIDPLVVQYYRDGAVDVAAQKSVEAVQPHCPACSAAQGGQLSAFSRAMKKYLGLQ
ncbi:two-partner secretion domain-containing protein [Pseudomonas sp. TE3610]